MTRNRSLAAALFCAGCARPPEPVVPPPRLPVAGQVELFIELSEEPLTPERTLRGVGKISAAEARGRWHWRIHSKNAKTWLAEQVRPDGFISREMRISHGAGSLSLSLFDSYGTLTSKSEIFTDGRKVTTLRSGEVSDEGCAARKFSQVAPHVFESRCLIESGAEHPDRSGCARWREGFSEEGLRISRECLLPQGDALDPRFPVTRLVYQGAWHVESRFFDASGKPRPDDDDGCFGTLFGYDAAGALVSTTCIDAQGAPMNKRGSEVASRFMTRDDRGCLIRESFSNQKNELADHEGAKLLRYESNEHCSVVFFERFGHPKKLKEDRAGVAVWRYSYDSRGNLIKQSCFDDERAPAGCGGNTWGAGSTILWEHDEHGRVTLQRHLWANGSAAGRAGELAHSVEFIYDKKARMSVRRFYGVSGKPTTIRETVGQEGLSRDVLGRVVRISSFDWSGEPVENEQGYHSEKKTLDELGRLARIEYLTRTGAPASLKESGPGALGWGDRTSKIEIFWGPEVRFEIHDAQGKTLRAAGCRAGEAPCIRWR